MAIPENACGYPFPVEFLKMLVSTLMLDANGDVIGFNFTVASARDCDCVPAVNCNNSHVPPETLAVLGFGLDNCGHLAIKLVNCDGTFVSEPE